MTRYVTLAEYFWLAEQVTGLGADTITAPGVCWQTIRNPSMTSS